MSQNTLIKPVTNQFKGYTACFTGLWIKFSSVSEFESYFAKRGGTVASIPDKNCNFLVCGNFTQGIHLETT